MASDESQILAKLLELSGNGSFVVTLDDVAVKLGVHRSSARRWVTKLVNSGALECDFVEDKRGRGTARVMRLRGNSTHNTHNRGTIFYGVHGVLGAPSDASHSFVVPPLLYTYSNNMSTSSHGAVETHRFTAPRGSRFGTPIVRVVQDDKSMTSDARLSAALALIADDVEDDVEDDFFLDGRQEAELDEALKWIEKEPEQAIETRPEVSYVEAALLPYPMFPLIRTPEPPRLSGDEGQDRALIRNAYVAARQKRFPSAANRPLPRNVEEISRRTLTAMRKSGIDEPHVWAMFRLSWSKEVRPMSTVFSVKAFQDATVLEMYARDSPTLRQGWSVLPPAYKQLVHLWHQARNFAVSRCPASVEDARAELAKVLDKNTYNELLREAKKEARLIRARMSSRIDAGEWLWNQIVGVRG